MTETNVQAAVREKYGAIAKAVGQTGGCCGPTPCGCGDPITRSFLTETGLDVDRLAPEVEGRFASAFIRARKPDAKNCCGPECCA
jgi:hypothetical protein